MLPQLKEPGWRWMIGDPYVCISPLCNDHLLCGDHPSVKAPRAECVCHNCSQRRWMRARQRELKDQEPSVAALLIKARKERKREKKTRLARAIAGEFTPVRRRTAAA